MEADVVYFEARKDLIKKRAIEDMDAVLPFQQLVEIPPNVFEETVSRETNGSQLDVTVSNIAHFFLDVPETFAIAPSTPKMSTVDVNVAVSDRGKKESQQKWITLMQMTPTRLTI